MIQDTRALIGKSESALGHELHAWDGEFIGHVGDVIDDEATGEPAFLCVRQPGRWHALRHDDHLVPTHRSYWDGDHVVTPFTREVVLRAPHPPTSDGGIDDGIEEAVSDHYHLWFYALLERIPACDPIAFPDSARYRDANLAPGPSAPCDGSWMNTQLHTSRWLVRAASRSRRTPARPAVDAETLRLAAPATMARQICEYQDTPH